MESLAGNVRQCGERVFSTRVFKLCRRQKLANSVDGRMSCHHQMGRQPSNHSASGIAWCCSSGMARAAIEAKAGKPSHPDRMLKA